MEKQTIIDRLNKLGNTELIEALKFYFQDHYGIYDFEYGNLESDPLISAMPLKTIMDEVITSPDQMRELCLFILMNALEKEPEKVIEAVEGAGSKQEIVIGTSLLVLIGFGLMFIKDIVQTVYAKGKEKEFEKTTISEKDGNITISTEKKTFYAKTDSGLGKAIKGLISKFDS